MGVDDQISIGISEGLMHQDGIFLFPINSRQMSCGITPQDDLTFGKVSETRGGKEKQTGFEKKKGWDTEGPHSLVLAEGSKRPMVRLRLNQRCSADSRVQEHQLNRSIKNHQGKLV